ncbi:MAG: type II toxin-antitoxin system PemK/MazF family toxin, partial [Candidatus Baltobacteraceae bacterium]
FTAPTRVACRFQGRDGFLLLDQLRSVDKSRLTRRLGSLDEVTLKLTLRALRSMFTP